MDSTIRVVTHICVKTGREDQMLQILLGAREDIRNQPGCIQYDFFRNERNPSDFVCLEEWRNDTAIDGHRDAPQTAELHREMEPLLDVPMDIRRYQSV